jgi:predicted MPP superfamily phosphohydrolase
VFFVVALSIWTALNGYVFWRLSTLPWIDLRFPPALFWTAAAGLWAAYPVARILSSRRIDSLALPLEYLAAFWIGLAFLLFSGFLVLDLLTLGGSFFSGYAGALRTGMALTALVLGIAAFVQWKRSPVVQSREIRLRGLSPAHDGLRIALVSDLHLGTLLDDRWAGTVVDRINSLDPDLVVLVGDIIDGDIERVTPMLPTLARLKARLGVYAVAGNHDHYAGLAPSLALFEQAGFRLLQSRWAEPVDGLVLAGIDDLTATGLRGQDAAHAVARALEGAPADHPVILLSHTPLTPDEVGGSRVDLVLSGHTHGGQIWPFGHLVALRHPHVSGLHTSGATQHLVGRGAGTWAHPCASGPQARSSPSSSAARRLPQPRPNDMITRPGNFCLRPRKTLL